FGAVTEDHHYRCVSPVMSISVSFEFFPPGDADMEATLWKSVERLAPLAPRFVSVTYGADGSTRERTHKVITRIQRETTLTGAPPRPPGLALSVVPADGSAATPPAALRRGAATSCS